MSTTQFDNIYLNQSRYPGRVRMAESGLGWKATEKAGGSSNAKVSEPFLLPSEEVQNAHWSRGSRGYEVRVQTKNQGVLQLDGFDVDDLNAVKSAIKQNFDVTLEQREHSLRGWNWGKADFERSEMVFNVANRPAFELPYSSISNSNVVGKADVAVEFNLQASGERVTAGDELVEMHFYVPGVVSSKNEDGEENGVKKEEKTTGEEDEDEEDEDEEEQNAAQLFYDSLKEKADIGQVAGEAIVSFKDILFLTPRGRYDIDMYPTTFRLRGKTYDYKLPFKNIQRIFLLPKPDETHNIIVIQLDPPLRQGQTRYPFLVIQFLKEEDMEVELNVDEKEFAEKYADKLKKKYDEAAHQVVCQLFKGLSGRKVVFPGSYMSSHNQAAVSCSLKASEGSLYALEKCFLFVPKPTVYIPISEISYITFSRVSGSVSSSRTFDLAITLRNNGGEHQFSNIDREEQKGLEAYIKSKSIKIKNDIAAEQAIMATALNVSDDSDVDMAVDRGSADEDEESVDEDFHDDGESDVAEEFDSNAESSSGESGSEDGDEEEEDVDDDEDSGAESAPAPKKPKN